MCLKAENFSDKSHILAQWLCSVTQLVSESDNVSQNKTACVWCNLKMTIQTSMCLLMAGVLQVCTYPAWRRSVDQGWRRHCWYCATWRVALTCGCIHCSIETEVHCKQCNCICLAEVTVSTGCKSRWLLLSQRRFAPFNYWYHKHMSICFRCVGKHIRVSFWQYAYSTKW